jgi:hypothetical protein
MNCSLAVAYGNENGGEPMLKVRLSWMIITAFSILYGRKISIQLYLHIAYFNYARALVRLCGIW